MHWRLVGTPAKALGSVAKAATRKMVVADLHHELGLEWLPFGRALGRPAAQAAGLLPVKPGGATNRLSLAVRAGFSACFMVDVNPT
jgi:hypothetical protein